MDRPPDVGLVDPHAKGLGRDENLDLVVDEVFGDFVATFSPFGLAPALGWRAGEDPNREFDPPILGLPTQVLGDLDDPELAVHVGDEDETGGSVRPPQLEDVAATAGSPYIGAVKQHV